MTKIDSGQEEKELWRGRASLWNWWLQILIADLLVLLAGALWWAGELSYAPYAAGGAAAIYAFIGTCRLSNLYILTSHRAISRKGFFSRRHDEVEVRDIRNITVDQSFLQRLVQIGDIGLSSAGGDGIEVSFDGVGDAVAVKERIRQARLAPAVNRRTLSAPAASTDSEAALPRVNPRSPDSQTP